MAIGTELYFLTSLTLTESFLWLVTSRTAMSISSFERYIMSMWGGAMIPPTTQYFGCGDWRAERVEERSDELEYAAVTFR